MTMDKLNRRAVLVRGGMLAAAACFGAGGVQPAKAEPQIRGRD
jgi:hypothetical protein